MKKHGRGRAFFDVLQLTLSTHIPLRLADWGHYTIKFQVNDTDYFAKVGTSTLRTVS